MGKDHYNRRGQEFADLLHERSRLSAVEYRKLLTSLSTGSLALFFIAVTTEIKPPLTVPQLYIIGLAVLSMAVAVFAGLFCWYADSQRNYFWAKVEEGKQKSGGPEFDTLGKQWKKRLYTATSAQQYSFAFGVFFSVAYMLARLLSI